MPVPRTKCLPGNKYGKWTIIEEAEPKDTRYGRLRQVLEDAP